MNREKYRQPTVEEAVDWLLKSLTKEYRRNCLEFWREKYGEAYHAQVKQQFLTKWRTKK